MNLKYIEPKNGNELDDVTLKKGTYYFQVADIGTAIVGEFIKGVGTLEDGEGNIKIRYRVIKGNFVKSKELNIPVDHFEGEEFSLNDSYVGVMELRSVTKDEVMLLHRYEILKGE